MIPNIIRRDFPALQHIRCCFLEFRASVRTCEDVSSPVLLQPRPVSVRLLDLSFQDDVLESDAEIHKENQVFKMDPLPCLLQPLSTSLQEDSPDIIRIPTQGRDVNKSCLIRGPVLSEDIIRNRPTLGYCIFTQIMFHCSSAGRFIAVGHEACSENLYIKYFLTNVQFYLVLKSTLAFSLRHKVKCKQSLTAN